MAFNVNELKSRLAKDGGGARPALYKIDINSQDSDLRFSDSANILVKAAAIPAANIAPLTVNYGGRAYKVNGFRTFDIWTTTVINDENFEVRNKIQMWMRKLAGKMDGSRSTNFGQTPDSASSYLQGDASVQQVSTDGATMHTWKFHNLWPTELAEVPLDWSSDMLEEFTVTWAYDWWSHGKTTSTTDVITAAAAV